MITAHVADFWTEHLRRTLQSYDEPLLRLVAGKLCKPRSHWPAEELIDRCLATFANAAGLDRRLKDLDPAGRALLALIAQSRQNLWPVGNLIEMLAALGYTDGLGTVQGLLEAGLLFPKLFAPGLENGKYLTGKNRLKQFSHWLMQAIPAVVLAHPAVTQRALAAAPEFPPCPGAVALAGSGQEADGLEWPLRLAVQWQQIAGAPMRRTQQGDFFKRDLDRLQNDPILSSTPADGLDKIPDPGLFTVALALAVGLIQEKDGEISAGAFPPVWDEGLSATLAALWSALPGLHSWDAGRGWHPAVSPGNPYPSACLLALVLLAQLPKGQWADPEAVERWIVRRHPYWAQQNNGADIAGTSGKERLRGKPAAQDDPAAGIACFLLGLAYPLRLVQAARNPDGAWMLRLSALGRWLLGLAEAPPALPALPQTLLVQPNLEILAYRQGLTPELIIRLTRCATWKGLGAACTLQLEPSSVYRALESGETCAGIVQTFERHGMKGVPSAVLDSLRTWSNKRERISIYPSGALFEFPGPAELADALTRGLPAMRLTERLAVVANEGAIDYRHFRLTGTRDYCLPPEKCVDVESDGVTLDIDLARSDLLLETEVQGLAEAAVPAGPPGHRLYRLTPASLAAAQHAGWTLANLESWFQHRTGLPLSPAALLLFSAAEVPPLEIRRQLVLHLPSPAIADGLQQWPETRDLIQGRLGPSTLAVPDQHLDELRRRCQELGLRLFHGEG